MDHTANFHSQPSYRAGANFPVFTGSRCQRGGGIFGSLRRMFAPIAKRVGKKLLSHGIGLARDVTENVLSGKNIKKSIANCGKSRAISFGKEATRSMLGHGRRRKPSSKHAPVKHLWKGSSRKRRHSTKSFSRKRSGKRRRVRSNFLKGMECKDTIQTC